MGSISCNQMAAITSQWWRRLVNTHKVKAGMVCLQCNNCVIHTWVFRSKLLMMGRYTNLSTFTCTFTTSMINSCGKLPLWSAGRLHHWRHSIAVQRLCLTEVNYVEYHSLQQHIANLYSSCISRNNLTNTHISVQKIAVHTSVTALNDFTFTITLSIPKKKMMSLLPYHYPIRWLVITRVLSTTSRSDQDMWLSIRELCTFKLSRVNEKHNFCQNKCAPTLYQMPFMCKIGNSGMLSILRNYLYKKCFSSHVPIIIIIIIITIIISNL